MKLETEVVNGRILTGTTIWWAKNTAPPHHMLYCIHRVPLTHGCNECRDETAQHKE